MIMKIYILPFLLVFILGCKKATDPEVPTPLEIDRSQLLASPDTINVDGRSLTLSTYMWRDFMPISSPDGKPLITIVYVTATDTATLPTTIEVDKLWIINEDQIWNSGFSEESIPPDQLKPNRIVRVAREGPKWGPLIYVDVIVRVRDSQSTFHLLRASQQWIERTD
jgi:hypothetical protein